MRAKRLNLYYMEMMKIMTIATLKTIAKYSKFTRIQKLHKSKMLFTIFSPPKYTTGHERYCIHVVEELTKIKK